MVILFSVPLIKKLLYLQNCNMKLYSYFRSSCSYRVRIALNFKGISYEQMPVNLLKNEQRWPSNLSRNPQGLVPSLEHEGETLTQSLAIIEYLEDLFPYPSLLPQEPIQRAEVRAISQIIACDTQPVQNLRVLKYVVNELQKTSEDKLKWGRHFIELGFNALESRIQNTTGTYAYGGQLSLIDVCLVPQVYNAIRFNVNLDKYPLIKKVYRNCLMLACVDLARPEVQPDCPETLRS